MKKFISLLTALLLVLSCTACDKTPLSTVSGSTSVETNIVASNTSSQSVEPVEEINLTKPESKGFVMENSTETKTVYIAIYPIDAVRSIFQFDVVTYKIGDEIPETMNYALCFERQENGDYVFNETDQNGDAVTLTATYIEGNELMISGSELLSQLTGIFSETDYRCEVADVTVLYFLRNVPEAGIGDFALYSPMDEIECYIAGNWYIYCNLYSEGEFMYSFLVAKDFSVIINMTSSPKEVIYGSLENTLNATHTYQVYNEDEELITVEEPLVGPVVYNGTTMNVGSTEEVFIAAPYDLTRSLEIESGNTDVVTVDGTAITAVAPGTATLTITADYCGTVKDFNLDIEVIEEDTSIEIDENEEYADSEFVDPKYSTYFDSTSMRATMDVCFEDGLISVDILWADDAYTEHHWSYVGSDEEYQSVYYLNGRYTIDTYSDDGSFTEEVVAENIDATLTRGMNDCFYWYDCFEETDHGCIFELPEY